MLEKQSSMAAWGVVNIHREKISGMDPMGNLQMGLAKSELKGISLQRGYLEEERDPTGRMGFWKPR